MTDKYLELYIKEVQKSLEKQLDPLKKEMDQVQSDVKELLKFKTQALTLVGAGTVLVSIIFNLVQFFFTKG